MYLNQESITNTSKVIHFLLTQSSNEYLNWDCVYVKVSFQSAKNKNYQVLKYVCVLNVLRVPLKIWLHFHGVKGRSKWKQ